MKWCSKQSFLLAANIHGGSVVVSYPYDGNNEGRDGLYSQSADDDVFIRLASSYANSSPT